MFLIYFIAQSRLLFEQIRLSYSNVLRHVVERNILPIQPHSKVVHSKESLISNNRE